MEDKKGKKRWRKPSFLFDVNEKPYFWELILGSVVQWIVFHPDSDREMLKMQVRLLPVPGMRISQIKDSSAGGR
ncbi:MAG: hypothetical protein EBR30_05000 [Cytophagia bacterium]|nr:hypothetical protein [Cytophagia bacterium]